MMRYCPFLRDTGTPIRFWRTPLTAMFASSWASATGSPTVRTLLGDLARFAAATRMGSCVIVVVSWRGQPDHQATFRHHRSEEHTSELQSLMRISYAVFCLKKKKTTIKTYRS